MSFSREMRLLFYFKKKNDRNFELKCFWWVSFFLKMRALNHLTLLVELPNKRMARSSQLVHFMSMYVCTIQMKEKKKKRSKAINLITRRLKMALIICQSIISILNSCNSVENSLVIQVQSTVKIICMCSQLHVLFLFTL